jgi:serine/threonine-protein kinase HipA
MARPRTHIPLDVYQNGSLVGHLSKSTSGAIDFKYAADWLHSKEAAPVSHSLPLQEDGYAGDPVIAVFDNLLPDNDDIRRRIAQQSGAAGSDIYNLLAAIGRDCVGALQFLPAGHIPDKIGTIAGEPLSETQIASILKELKTTPLGVSNRDDDFRISIAGAQEKTALLYWNGKWIKPHGTTPTTHILKPQIGVRSDGIDLSRSVENEHFCMSLCANLGLRTAKTSISDFDGQRVLVVERFDRRSTNDAQLVRVAQEDCCQALSVPSVRKYQNNEGPGIVDILSLLKASDSPDEDQHFFLKAQVVFWLLGATDGHAKNFSIFLHPGGGFKMTPLYDVMSTQPLVDAKQLQRKQMKLAMSVGDNRHYAVDTIRPHHFLQTAKRAGVPDRVIHSIAAELEATVPKALKEIGSQMPKDFPDDISSSIASGAERRLETLKKELH